MKYALFVAALVASLNVSAQQCRDLKTPVRIIKVHPVYVGVHGRQCNPKAVKYCYPRGWYVDWVNEQLGASGQAKIKLRSNGKTPTPRVGQWITTTVRQCF